MSIRYFLNGKEVTREAYYENKEIEKLTRVEETFREIEEPLPFPVKKRLEIIRGGKNGKID